MDPSLLPLLPYRGLKSFRYPDQNIFSGREIEVDKIYRLILQFRGLMLFGPSGTGKSSLVGAGLLPLLISKSFSPELIRLNPDDNGTFVVARILKNEEQTEYFSSYFDEFIDPANPGNDKINISFSDFEKKISALTSVVSDEPGPIKIKKVQRNKITVLIFDQFEELITHFEESLLTDNLKTHSLSLAERVALQERIIKLLTECYYKENMFVKLVFAFREDYLAKFGKLFNSMPDLKDHYLRIRPLQASKLLEVISRPFDTEEKRIHFKEPFSESLINSISTKMDIHFQDGNLILTEVQIVCLQLYNTHPDEMRIKVLNEHSVSKILENFYLDLLNKLSAAERPLAIDILSLLVLNEKTRNIYHEDAIVEELEKTYKVDAIKRVINKLEDEISIIRREIRQGGTYYEIVSEAIIPDINRKRIEKEKEKVLTTKKKKQQFWGIVAFSVIALGIAGFFYNKSNKFQRIERIKMAELAWYQKLPDDSIRNEAIQTLDRFDPSSIQYKKYKTLFAILAQSYYYSSVNNYNDALAIAYFASKGLESNGNNPVQQKFKVRINDFMMPFKTSALSMSSVLAAFPGSDGKYFLLSAEMGITVKDAFDASFTRMVDIFRTTPAVAPPQTYNKYIRQRFQQTPAIDIVHLANNSKGYLMYNKSACYVFDGDLQQIHLIKGSHEDILAVFPFYTDRFLVLYGDGSYDNCWFTGNKVATERRRASLFSDKEKPTNITTVNLFDNKNYFAINYTSASGMERKQCEIQNNGDIISKPIADDENILGINLGRMRLVSADRKNFRIRNERYISSFIPGSTSASLLGDTNLVVSYRYNKAAIYDINVADSGLMLSLKQVIGPLPENRVPVVYSRGEHIIIKSRRSFILYGVKTAKKRFLYSSYNQNENGMDIVDRSVDLFINDSIFAIINDRSVNFYDVGDHKNYLTVSNEQDGSLRKVAFNLLKNNDEMDQEELFNLFPQELGKGLLEAFFLMGNYDSCVALSKKLLKAKPENKTYLYQYLYDSYENMRNALPATTRNIQNHLFYTRQMVRYSDSLFLLKGDTSRFYSNHLKAMGALSWYLILSGDYKNALDTASLAISLDKNKQQQWINTNLALSYLFNDSIPAAFRVYKTWANEYFNDDFKKAKVRFMEDIDNLKSIYGIDIPRRTEVLNELK